MPRPISPTEGALEAVQSVRRFKRRFALSDAALGRLVQADQSSVHRALNRPRPVWTPTLRKLWDYAKTAGSIRDEPRRQGRKAIAQAFDDAWDGTAEGLDRLLRLLAIISEIERAAVQNRKDDKPA